MLNPCNNAEGIVNWYGSSNFTGNRFWHNDFIIISWYAENKKNINIVVNKYLIFIFLKIMSHKWLWKEIKILKTVSCGCLPKDANKSSLHYISKKAIRAQSSPFCLSFIFSWSHAGVFLCKAKHLLCLGKGVIEVSVFVNRFDKLWQQKLSFLYFGMNSHPFIGPLMLFQSVTLYPQAII